MLPKDIPALAHVTFIQYLRTQKKLLLLVPLAALVYFILFKICFPFPDFFLDSTSYIVVAYHKVNIAYRPTGYCYFLRGVHELSADPTFTVFIQYLVFVLSTLLCFFSVDHLFGLPAKHRKALVLLLVLNPLHIFLTNLISSDSLFNSLTVLFFTLCLWIIKRDNWGLIVLMVLCIYVSMEVRYTAMFFPVVAFAAILFSPFRWIYKGGSVALIAVALFLQVNRQKDITEEVTGKRIFSGFSGWQIANNALYCYPYIDLDPADLPTDRLRYVNSTVRDRIDTIPVEPNTIGVEYLWDARSPLKLYQYWVFKYAHLTYFNAWFAVSEDFSQYGWYIIKHYPIEFTRYYLLPNTLNYLYPGAEVLSGFDAYSTKLPPETRLWFDLDSDHVTARTPALQKYLMMPMPALTMLLHLFNIGFIFFFVFKTARVFRKIPAPAWKLFFFWLIFYGVFTAFTIFAARVNLRFMGVLFIVGIIVPLSLLNYIKVKAVENEG